jgi:DNA sulfur modification protein DndC
MVMTSPFDLNKETGSIFDVRTLEDIYKEIQETYISSGVPWVIGYSGGKDSTTVVQLVWYAPVCVKDMQQLR